MTSSDPIAAAAKLPAPFDTLRESTPAGSTASPQTLRAEYELQRAAAGTASERTLNRLRVLFHLAQLADDGVVKSLSHSNGGWLLEARGFRGERRYTLRELEAFVHGCDAARDL